MKLEHIIKLNDYIEHTLLKPDTTFSEIKDLCTEAMENNFNSVCVPPYFVKNAALILNNSTVKVTTVVGFPLGFNLIPAKVEEVKRAVNDGVDQIDMVVNIAAVKNDEEVHHSESIKNIGNFYIPSL